MIGLRGVGTLHFDGVPFETFADSIGDVAEMIGFGQPAGVLEVAGGRSAGLARLDPFGMVTDRCGNERIGTFEVGELLFGEQDVLAVI